MTTEARSELMKDEKLAALTALLFDRMDAPLRLAAGAAEHAQGDGAADTHFTGIMLGVCAATLLHSDDAKEDDYHTVAALVSAVSAYMEEAWGEHSEGDVNETIRRLVPSAFGDDMEES